MHNRNPLPNPLLLTSDIHNARRPSTPQQCETTTFLRRRLKRGHFLARRNVVGADQSVVHCGEHTTVVMGWDGIDIPCVAWK